MLSTFDLAGGAARATYRIHRGLIEAGVESRLLVRYKTSDDPTVIGPSTPGQRALVSLHKQFEVFPLRAYPRRDAQTFSPGGLAWPQVIDAQLQSFQPDLVNPHWIAQGFSAISLLGRLRLPVVWTLQDLWPLTGGCHYFAACEGYTRECGACPQLGSTRERDLSHRVMRRKRQAWQQADLSLVPISRWVEGRVACSSLLASRARRVIPNGLDTRIYRPIDKAQARAIWGLPTDRKLILFGAISATQDRRKGFHLLVEALRKLRGPDWQGRAELLVFGSSQLDPALGLELPVRALGHLHDDVSLNLLYAAADVMVVPSTEEAFGQTASESLAAGTPVVAFDGTGVADIVVHRESGYLARPGDANDLAAGIAWVLADDSRYRALCIAARQRAVERFDLRVVVDQYRDLFEERLAARLA